MSTKSASESFYMLPAKAAEALGQYLIEADVRPGLISMFSVFPSNNGDTDVIGVCLIHQNVSVRNSSPTAKRMRVSFVESPSLGKFTSEVAKCFDELHSKGFNITHQEKLRNPNGTYIWIALSFPQ